MDEDVNEADSNLETAEDDRAQVEEDIEEIEAEEISTQDEEIKVGDEISIGDRVMVEDCPGHWSWAQPFQVLAIEGNMVALELVDELVEISRLRRC
jgi:putative DNA primase/helicase